MGNCMSQSSPTASTSVHISRTTQTPQIEISSSEAVLFTKQNRSGNIIERLSSLEEAHEELSVTVNVLLSEIAKVKKDTLKK